MDKKNALFTELTFSKPRTCMQYIRDVQIRTIQGLAVTYTLLCDKQQWGHFLLNTTDYNT